MASFDFRPLGSGYEGMVECLRDARYDVAFQAWVPNYADAVAEADIRVLPIAVRTGTKFKTLQGLATGLVATGGEFVFDNVEVTPGIHVLQYVQVEEVIDHFLAISEDQSRHRDTAQQGAAQVRRLCAPDRAAKLFWGKALQKTGFSNELACVNCLDDCMLDQGQPN